MFWSKPLAWWKVCILFWSIVNRLCSSLLQEGEFVSFIYFTTGALPPLLDVWSQIQCSSQSPKLISAFFLACCCTACLYLSKQCKQYWVPACTGTQLADSAGLVSHGWVSCVTLLLSLGFGWLGNSSMRRASLQRCKLSPGRLWDITAISWLGGREFCVALYFWPKGSLW